MTLSIADYADQPLYAHMDSAGNDLVIDADPDSPTGRVFIIASHDGARLHPHEIKRAVTAMCKAADLPVPDMQDIPNPADLQSLARAIHDNALSASWHPDERDIAAARAALAWFSTRAALTDGDMLNA